MDIPSKFPWVEGTLPNGDSFIKCAEGKDVAYFPPHTSIYHGDRRAANIRYVLEMPAELADAQAEIARLRGALEALEADAHLIFNNPPSECPQIARDVIEWYAGSIRVALERNL